MSENQASGYLCANGSSVFFDEDGNQIISMQKHGWCGLHLFYEKYPNAPIRILTEGENVEIKYAAFLLKQIKKPRKSKDNDTVRITS